MVGAGGPEKPLSVGERQECGPDSLIQLSNHYQQLPKREERLSWHFCVQVLVAGDWATLLHLLADLVVLV